MLLDHVTQSSILLKSLWKTYIYAFYIKGIKKKKTTGQDRTRLYHLQTISVYFSSIYKKGKKKKLVNHSTWNIHNLKLSNEVLKT